MSRRSLRHSPRKTPTPGLCQAVPPSPGPGHPLRFRGLGLRGCGLLGSGFLGCGLVGFGVLWLTLAVWRFGVSLRACRFWVLQGFGWLGCRLVGFRVLWLLVAVSVFGGVSGLRASGFRSLRFLGCGLNPGMSFHGEYARKCQAANLFSTCLGGHFKGSAVAPHAPVVAIP